MGISPVMYDGWESVVSVRSGEFDHYLQYWK